MEEPEPLAPLTTLRHLRKRANLTQPELAVRAGVSIGTVIRFERATNPKDAESIGVGLLLKIADVLGIPATVLYPRLGEPPA